MTQIATRFRFGATGGTLPACVLVGAFLSGCGADAGAPGGAPGAAGKTSTGTGGSASASGSGGATASSGGVSAAGGVPGSGGVEAAGGAPSADAGAGEGASTPPSGVDPSGTWISEMQTTGTETVPTLGSPAVNLDLVFRLFVTESGGKLTTTFDVCRIHAVTFPDPSTIRVTFTPTVVATLTTTSSESAPALAAGGPFPFPPLTIRSGIDVPGAPVDADGDGHPALTIPADIGNGWLNVDGYVGFTMNATLTATLADPNTMSGTMDFSAIGTVFGSTSPLLTSGTITVKPDSPQTPFTARRLPGNVACQDVLLQFP